MPTSQTDPNFVGPPAPKPKPRPGFFDILKAAENAAAGAQKILEHAPVPRPINFKGMGESPAASRVCPPQVMPPMNPVTARLNNLPFFLCADQPDNSFTVPSLGVSDILSFGVNGRGPAEVCRWSIKATDANNALVSISINEGPNDVPIMNSASLVSNIFGTNLNPYPLPESLYIDDLRKIKMWFTNLNSVDNAFRPVLRARQNLGMTFDPNATLGRIQLQDKLRVTMPYFYTPDGGGVTITASTTQDIPISIDPNYDFFLKQISYRATSTSLLLDIIDANTNRSLVCAPQDRHYPVNIALLAGSGAFPGRIHHPVCFHAGQRIILRFSDTSGSDNIVYITLGGRNVARRMWGRSGQ